MSALARANSYRVFDEQEWLESSDKVDLSPAAVWAPDYDEEDETTLPGRRVDVPHIDLTSPNIDSEDVVVNRPRQVRRLDESQVLPGEASFATVVLNQPLEENVLKPQHFSEPILNSTVADYREDRSASPVRLLDESQVLEGEASLATRMLYECSRAQPHSPLTEFFVKTKLTLTQLLLATSALVLVLALAVVALVSLTRSQVVTISSVPPITVDNASETVSTSIAPHESVLISNAQGEASGGVSSTPEVVIVEETQSVPAAKLTEGPSADDSQKAPSIDAERGAIRQETLREVDPVGARVSLPKEQVIEAKQASAPVARKARKKQAVVKESDASDSSERLEMSPKPATTQSEAPATVEKVEAKTPPTGGGERPRTVTRKPIP